MRTRNAARITPAESAHLAKVKRCACVLCDADPPTEAHHVIQGLHFATVALCTACHRGRNGALDADMLRLRYGTADLRAQVRAINETQRRVAALEDE